MKTMKLIVGIISIVLSLLILLQSCAAAFADAFLEEGGTSAASGIMVFVIMLSTGIVAITARKSRGAAIYCTIAYTLAGLLGISVKGAYEDLIVWGLVAFIFAILFFISIFTQAKQAEWPPPPPQHGNYPQYW